MSYLITLDVDWASDEMIRHCAGILAQHRVKATWLITHQCDALDDLAAHSDLFELGIHPNFHAGSTQGDTPEATLEHLLRIVPGARTVRTHGLLQSTALLRLMVGGFGIENDLSLLLPDAAHLQPHEFHLPEGVLRRFPTFWEDDAEMLRPGPSFSFDDAKYHLPGLKVFDFHPVLIALNAHTLDPYDELKSKHPVDQLTMADLEPYANRGSAGDETLFRRVVEHIAADPDTPSQTVSELANEWSAGSMPPRF